MNKALLISGVVIAGIGAGGPILLPQAPASIQSNPSLQSAGVWIIDNGNYLVLFALLLILIAALVPLG
jgi:hypothetical protein